MRTTPRVAWPALISLGAIACAAAAPAAAQNDLRLLSDEFGSALTTGEWLRVHLTEHWNAEQLEVYDIDQTTPGRMTMIPYTVVWYQDWRGPMAYKEASGDFYDMFQLDRGGSAAGRVGVVVCDVAGKGIASALVMSATRAALRSESVRHASPGAVLSRVNRMLANSVPPGLFVTAFYGIYDPASGRLRYASGGHPHPIRHSRRDLTTTDLRSDGLPLGLLAEADYEDQTVVLDPGDLVVVYTDGLVEALDTDRQMYGFDAAHEAVAASAGVGGEQGAEAAGHLDAVVEDMRRFIGDERLHDDVTVVVLSITDHASGGSGAGDADG